MLTPLIPKHIAIVMDGNGRWASERGMPRIEGHKAGVESVKCAIKACIEQGVNVLSLFAFSSENWTRPQQEVSFLMQLFIEALDREIDQLHHRGIKLSFCGEKSQLSESLREKMAQCERLTQKNACLHLNIVVNYGGKWDITQAARRIAQAVSSNQITLEEINEDIVASHLSTHPLPEPDLLIRTSGEQRLSNFFLWQLAYAELYFCDCYWPEFTEEQLTLAIAYYAKRERRYGGVSNDEECNV